MNQMQVHRMGIWRDVDEFPDLGGALPQFSYRIIVVAQLVHDDPVRT
ncbi:hypothetical protein AB0M12_38600 [Nocardia vinacea]